MYEYNLCVRLMDDGWFVILFSIIFFKFVFLTLFLATINFESLAIIERHAFLKRKEKQITFLMLYAQARMHIAHNIMHDMHIGLIIVPKLINESNK